MSIFLSPSVRRRLAVENVVKAVLGAVSEAGDAGLPASRLRRLAFLGMPAERIQQIENRLVREGILVLRGDRLHLATRESINAFLARSGWMDSPVAAVAPAAEKPLVVAPGDPT